MEGFGVKRRPPLTGRTVDKARLALSWGQLAITARPLATTEAASWPKWDIDPSRLCAAKAGRVSGR